MAGKASIRTQSPIAAFTINDTEQALALVNAGADPNTRFSSPPAPTFKLLLNQLLRRSSTPDTDSPTAFMLVCGATWHSASSGDRIEYESSDDLTLPRTMLTHGADYKAHALNNQSVLHFAVKSGDCKVTRLLIQHGANINEQNCYGTTPLMVAASNRDADMTRLLLAYGANVSVEDYEGKTALHYAVGFHINRTLIAQLLAHGANSYQPNKDGDTALALVPIDESDDIVAVLRGKR